MYYYVDHTSRFQRNTGIQRCVRVIAAALLAAGVPLRPVVWNRERGDFEAPTAQALEHLGRWSGPDPLGWGRGAAPPRDNWLLIVELVRGPHQPTAAQLGRAAQRRGLRLAWVFHDAIPVRLVHLYGVAAEATAASHRAYMAGLAQADLVLANSGTTAGHLRAFLQQRGLPRDHVQALPLALEFSGVPRGAPRLKGQREARAQRLLCVGSLERRKNHAGLLKAVAWLAAQQRFGAELVLVGWPNDPAIVALVRRALALGLPLRWEDSADDERLAELYRWCDATVVASLEEGFGLPLAESLWQGRPCLSTTEGALGELAAGGGCLPLAGVGWRQLADGLQVWLTDQPLRERLAQEVERRPLCRWSDYVADVLAWLDHC
uniref:glycosyltransferase n=1 Tax=Cyanobium sp. TaxID=2164130 RepID=UPI004048AF65